VSWDTEPTLDGLVAKGTEYRIDEETVDSNLIMSLGLTWTFNRANNTRVTLSHRLKEKYRHALGDLKISSGHDALVSFDQPNSGPDKGRWVISVKRKPKWLVDRVQNAETAKALLGEISRANSQLESGYPPDLLGVANWFNGVAPISIASYEELKGIGAIVRLGGQVGPQVDQAYEALRRFNRAVDAVNRRLIDDRDRALKFPERLLANDWFAAWNAKQEFLRSYSKLEGALKALAAQD
jgi:hypothetical protein